MRLFDLKRVLLDKAAGDVADLLRASERRVEHQARRVRKDVFEFRHDMDIGAGEAVDALPVVADDAEMGGSAGALGESLQKANSRARTVLEFIGQDDRVRADEATGFDVLCGLQDHVLEVDGVVCFESLFPFVSHAFVDGDEFRKRSEQACFDCARAAARS